MGLINLTLVEFLAIFGPTAAAVVALYLYDRTRRRHLVSTLRFFPKQAQAPVFSRRKKIQQPWSLLLQLVSIALLLLAIAELELGGPGQTSQDHVLILDTSAWMGAADGRGTLLQTAQQRALDYLRAVPSGDRVLVVRADALVTPVTTFTSDHRQLTEAIQNSRAGFTALNLSAAVEFARNAQKLSSSHPGEIVIVSPGRVGAEDPERLGALDRSNMRAILFGQEPNDCGIRRLSARRSPTDPNEWEVEVGVRNYGASSQRVPVRLSFGGKSSEARTFTVPARGTAESAFRLRAGQPGMLEAVLDIRDDYWADNRAAVELPGLAALKVQVFTPRPDLWRPLLTASRYLQPEFLAPGQYTPSGPAGRLVILDGFQPPAPPDSDSVLIAPPGPPRKTHVQRWNEQHPITAGLHNKDVQVSRVTILQPAAGETVVAESDNGPVITASQGVHKQVRLGFHPLDEGMENHLAIPLLFANIAQWVSPELFRSSEIRAASPGLIEMETPPGTKADQVQVSAPQNRDLVATLNENRVRLFSNRPGTVRVAVPQHEVVFSLSLPEVGEAHWTAPEGVKRGVPRVAGGGPLRTALWPWLALLGALGLLADWMLYGRFSLFAPAAASDVHSSATPPVTPQTAEPQEVRS